MTTLCCSTINIQNPTLMRSLPTLTSESKNFQLHNQTIKDRCKLEATWLRLEVLFTDSCSWSQKPFNCQKMNQFLSSHSGNSLQVPLTRWSNSVYYNQLCDREGLCLYPSCAHYPFLHISTLSDLTSITLYPLSTHSLCLLNWMDENKKIVVLGIGEKRHAL